MSNQDMGRNDGKEREGVRQRTVLLIDRQRPDRWLLTDPSTLVLSPLLLVLSPTSPSLVRQPSCYPHSRPSQSQRTPILSSLS